MVVALLYISCVVMSVSCLCVMSVSFWLQKKNCAWWLIYIFLRCSITKIKANPFEVSKTKKIILGLSDLINCFVLFILGFTNWSDSLVSFGWLPDANLFWIFVLNPEWVSIYRPIFFIWKKKRLEIIIKITKEANSFVFV